MANKKISELDPVVTVNGADLVPVVQSGITKKATVTQVTESTLATAKDYSIVYAIALG